MAKTSLSQEALAPAMLRLAQANIEPSRAMHLGSLLPSRQPIHTVYGGAHLFTADTARKMGELALRSLETYAPDFTSLAGAMQMPGWERLPTDIYDAQALDRALKANPNRVKVTNRTAWIAETVRNRVVAKLKSEPVEDYRIDFEDGYGVRSDAEEDGHAEAAGIELAKGLTMGTLPPRIGLRIKALDGTYRGRSLRTLDIVLTEMCARTGGKLPPGFVVTLAKVASPAQVTALAEALEALERALRLEDHSLPIELMVEQPRALFAEDGAVALPSLVKAGRERVVGVHLGAYDFTARLDVISTYQTMMHPAVDFARMIIATTMSRSGIWLSDGATIELPIEPHRPKTGSSLTTEQVEENRQAIHRAWRVSYENIQHSLRLAFYQGWDLHPAQLPPRYAATYVFFLDGIESAGRRLRRFLDDAGRATQSGGTFDDAASGQGLLNFFLRAESSGAVTAQEVQTETGLRSEELASRSFTHIVAARATRASSRK